MNISKEKTKEIADGIIKQVNQKLSKYGRSIKWTDSYIEDDDVLMLDIIDVEGATYSAGTKLKDLKPSTIKKYQMKMVGYIYAAYGEYYWLEDGGLEEVISSDKDEMLPQQGVFWIIDGILAGWRNKVDPNDFVEFGALNHRDVWRVFNSDYKVDGKCVEYDYFPRGCVIVCPTFDEDYNITGYDCCVYADACIIDDPEVRKLIARDFCLRGKTSRVSYLGDYASDNTHYTCHKCRK
jgi:hypothetical protein